MPFLGRRPDLRSLPEHVDVMIVKNEEFASLAVRRLIDRTKEDLKVFGLDCEWDLVTRKGAVHKPDILQIATVHGFCAIFRLHKFKTIPTDLKGFLEDPYFAKVGVGILDDRDKLRESFGVSTEGALDVRHIADDSDIPPKGLASLTYKVLGVNLTKYHYDFHQWTGRLTDLQTQYAAMDAIYAARVFYKLSHDRISQVYGDEWQRWSHQEYHEKTLALWEKYVSKQFFFDRSKFSQKHVINFMLTLGDLTPVLRGEHWVKSDISAAEMGATVREGRRETGMFAAAQRGQQETGIVTEERQTPEENPEFPEFKSKFLAKERKKKDKPEIRKVPKRSVKSFIRKMESKGIDRMNIPTDILPKSCLTDGKLDMDKVNTKIQPINYRRNKQKKPRREKTFSIDH